MQLSCRLCDARVFTVYLEDHLKVYHFNYFPFKCLHDKCRHQSTSRNRMKVHSQIKHNEMLKILIVGDSFLDRVCEHICKLHLSSTEGDVRLLQTFLSSVTFRLCTKIAHDLEIKWFKNKEHSDYCIPEKDSHMNCLVSPDSNLIDSSSVAMKLSMKKEITHDYAEFEKLYSQIVVEEKKNTNNVNTYPDFPSRSSYCSNDNIQPSCSTESSPFVFMKIKREIEEESLPIKVQHIVMKKKRMRTFERKPTISGSWPFKRFKVGCHWRLPCAVCGFAVSDSKTSRKKHALKHVPEKTDIKWLFKCLICPDDDTCMKSLYFASTVEKHIPKKHMITAPRLGVHYLNRNAELKYEVEAVYYLCFPY